MSQLPSIMRFTASCIVTHAMFVVQYAIAEESDAHVDYLTKVKPVLQRSCFACHGSLKQEAGLRVDTADAMLQGGDSGPAIEPGSSDDSLLVMRVCDEDESTRMPQEGAALSAAEIAAIRTWIDSGAAHPEEAIPPDPLDYWSFVGPVQPDVPAVSNERPLAQSANPIDRFIAARHAAVGLTPVAQADRYTLLRRVYIDLTGLPPTREELHAFLADESDDAYERVVDRLLASPRYGERWGRHWMDVWRYSDWDGHGDQVRESQPFLWRWRDWIVESLNADKPYDQMITEMIAGDELAPNDAETLRATGFLARNYHRFNRNTWLGNTVEHTGKAFLGLTFNCAKCHDHKYDPIAQKEYYEWRAAFEPYDVRIDPVPGTAETTKDGLARVYDAHLDAPTYLFLRGNEKQPDEESDIQPALPRILGGKPLNASAVSLPPEAWYPGLQRFVQEDRIEASRSNVAEAKATLRKAVKSVARLERAARPARVPPAPPSLHLENAHLADHFYQRDESLWLYGKGVWEYRDEALRQEDGSGHLCMVESKSPIPTDFVAQLELRVLGGDGYRSVGLSFDFADHDNFTAVYLSAGNPGLEVLRRVRAAEHFPPESRRQFPVKSNKIHELTIAVQGDLLNVWCDDRFVLAYKLPARPSEGKVALWTYEAVAEFRSLNVEKLGADAHLVEPGESPEYADTPEDPIAKRSKARQDREAAQAALDVAQQELEFTQAAVAADRVKYSTAAATLAHEDIKNAIRADRKLKLLKADQALLLAKHARDQVSDASVGEDELKRLDIAVSEAEKLRNDAEADIDELTGDYDSLGATYPKESSGRRLALAKAITDDGNPLTARVAVNHLWLRHFGAALVPSVFDFGHNGKRPTHPELLDWLAVEFMEQGWRMKPIHRLLVTSQVYRLQSNVSEPDSQNIELDRDNANYWRMNSRRLEAEAVRDAILLTTGRLDLSMGGPDLPPTSDVEIPRRSLYFRQSKEKRVPFLTVFDQAGVAECYRRSETVVPQQALAMANSDLVANSTAPIEEIVRRALGDEISDDSRVIEESFIHVLGRPCSHEEKTRSLKFFAQERDSADGPVRERFIHVLLNHHDFVTVR